MSADSACGSRFSDFEDMLRETPGVSERASITGGLEYAHSWKGSDTREYASDGEPAEWRGAMLGT